MRQRIMIALALALRPKFIVADEPTTALDVLVEAQILRILADIRERYSAAILLITHNLGIVAEACDRVAVMYAGRIVEQGPVREIFAEPRHPYTQELLRSTISLNTRELHSIDGAPPDLVDPPPAAGSTRAARTPCRSGAAASAVADRSRRRVLAARRSRCTSLIASRCPRGGGRCRRGLSSNPTQPAGWRRRFVRTRWARTPR